MNTEPTYLTQDDLMDVHHALRVRSRQLRETMDRVHLDKVSYDQVTERWEANERLIGKINYALEAYGL